MDSLEVSLTPAGDTELEASELWKVLDHRRNCSGSCVKVPVKEYTSVPENKINRQTYNTRRTTNSLRAGSPPTSFTASLPSRFLIVNFLSPLKSFHPSSASNRK